MIKPRENVWSEDYLRPKKLEDIKGQPAIAVFQAFVRSKKVVNCTIVGPPGVGKTTTVMALAHELYDGYNTAYNSCFMVLDASDNRGIEVVRTKIIDFAGRAPVEEVGFLICFLDDAERLPGSAQETLVATIEEHSTNCRFIFTCNNPTKLIEAIQSRGPLIPFYRIEDEAMKEIISEVCTKKGFTIQPEALERLLNNSNGDMRSMIKNLQMAYMLLPDIMPREITMEMLNKFLYDIDSETKHMLELFFKMDFSTARTSLENLFKRYSGEAIIAAIERYMKRSEELFPNKAAYLKTMGLIQPRKTILLKGQNKIPNSPYPIITTTTILGLVWEITLAINKPINCIPANK